MSIYDPNYTNYDHSYTNYDHSYDKYAPKEPKNNGEITYPIKRVMRDTSDTDSVKATKVAVDRYTLKEKIWEKHTSIKDYEHKRMNGSKKIEKPMSSNPIKKKTDISYDKLSRFNSLASKRVTKTMKSISLIGNLSNTYAYDYSDSDINKINEALDNAIVELKMKFNASNKITEFEL